MILLLNYAHWIILGLWVLILVVFWKKLTVAKMIVIGIIATLLALALQAANPSYLPKGTTGQLDNPPFEESEAPIEERLLKPKPGQAERLKQEFEESRNQIREKDHADNQR